MERLESQKVNGHTYYYYSKWGWKNGKCRRLWQKYLGKLERIVKACDGGLAPSYAEVFQFGLPTALWLEGKRQNIIREIDKLCPKRHQRMSIGDYITVAAVNRAISPVSKQSMWDWFVKTTLRRFLPDANEAGLSSQRFWDHMEALCGQVLSVEGIRHWNDYFILCKTVLFAPLEGSIYGNGHYLFRRKQTW